MVNRTVEKAPPLNRDRIPLGRVLPAPAIQLAEREPRGDATAAPVAAPGEADRSAEVAALREQCEQHGRRAAALEHELAVLEQALSELRQDLAEREAALEEMRAGLEAEYTQARAQGHADGVRAAEEHAQRELDERVAQWDDTLAGLGARIELQLQTLHASAAEIALAATARVIGEHLADPAHIAAAVAHVVRESGLSGPLTVWLAPAHYHELRCSGAVLDVADALELRPDPEVRAGGCRVENSELMVDGRFEYQLQRLADIVRAGFAKEPT